MRDRVGEGRRDGGIAVALQATLVDGNVDTGEDLRAAANLRGAVAACGKINTEA